MRTLGLVPFLLLAVSASALVPQQRGTPCDAAWDVGSATATPGPKPKQPWDVVCGDGDPSCDVDGDENGECLVSLGACAATATEGCTPQVVRTVFVPKSTQRILPDLTLPPPGTAGCGTPTTLRLPASHPRDLRAGVLLTLRSTGVGRRGSSRLRVRCVRPMREVDELSFVVSSSASDFDYGFSGASHNFTMWKDARFDVCLTGCDETTDSMCDVSVCVPQALPPMPLLSNGVPVCLALQMTGGTALGTFDLASGALSLPVTLRADVHVQMPLTDVCPRCSGGAIGAQGTCNSGERQGGACAVEAQVHVVGSPNPDYFLSSDCPPNAANLAASFPVATTFTTGETSIAGSKPCPDQLADDPCGAGTCTVDCSDTVPLKGGINQSCCSNNPMQPCFPTAPDSPPGRIVRSGIVAPLVPAWPAPTSSHTATGAVLASTFCFPRTADPTFDIVGGLPGPGALLLPVDMEVRTTIVSP
ncbi:MAG TPA: hypothetical protein VGR62_04790 [Candidatus Binatia bacterium]|jgi:hypothetical protein|nr:hypothetical protein [Candidatus Binatia bacterium]